MSIKKVIEELQNKKDQYERMAKESALRVIIGPEDQKEAEEKSALNYYQQHKSMIEAIDTAKYYYKNDK